MPVVPDIPPRVVAFRYLLVSQLGQGGMGRVWAARDELLNRDVAIKEVLPPPGLTEAERHDLRERILREARAIARLDHSNVVRIFDVLYDRGEPWIVMELVASRSLQQVLEHEGAMAPERVARIGLALLGALNAAHVSGVLHRDVKPANVLLADDGRVVLTDFGLATAAGDSSMTSTGVVMGSPSYLAPERALDQPGGPAADLWSLGATLYVAVEGTPPYSRSTPMATLTALATQPPRPPRRAGVLTPALAALLQKDPAKRADAKTAEQLLRQAFEPHDHSARVSLPPLSPPSWAESAAELASAETVPTRPRRRRRLVTAGAVLAVVVLAVAAGRLALTTTDAGAEAGAPPASWAPGTVASGPAGPAQVEAAEPSTDAPSRRPAGKPTTATAPTPAAGTKAAGTTTPTPGTGTGSGETTQAATGKPFVNMQTGNCLDVPDGAGTTADIQLWHCLGVDGQKFAFASDGTLRVYGKCLQVRGTDNGSRLRIATCTGASAQRFEYNNAYDLVNIQTDKCVDVPDGNSANGVPAQIWDCTGAGNQKWEF